MSEAGDSCRDYHLVNLCSFWTCLNYTRVNQFIDVLTFVDNCLKKYLFTDGFHFVLFYDVWANAN